MIAVTGSDGFRKRENVPPGSCFFSDAQDITGWLCWTACLSHHNFLTSVKGPDPAEAAPKFDWDGIRRR